MLTVIVAGRNDDYGKDFRERLLHAGDGQEVFKLLCSEEEAGK